MKKNELAKALESFMVVIDSFPKDPYAYKAQVQIGMIELRLRNIGNAIKACEKALTLPLDENHLHTVHITLVECYALINQTTKACDAIVKIDMKYLNDKQRDHFEKLKTRIKCPQTTSGHHEGQKVQKSKKDH